MCLDFCLGHQWLKLVFTLLIPIKGSFYDYSLLRRNKVEFYITASKETTPTIFSQCFYLFIFSSLFGLFFFLLFVGFISLFLVEWRLGVVLLNALLPNCSFNVCIFSINQKHWILMLSLTQYAQDDEFIFPIKLLEKQMITLMRWNILHFLHFIDSLVKSVIPLHFRRYSYFHHSSMSNQYIDKMGDISYNEKFS